MRPALGFWGLGVWEIRELKAFGLGVLGCRGLQDPTITVVEFWKKLLTSTQISGLTEDLNFLH